MANVTPIIKCIIQPTRIGNPIILESIWAGFIFGIPIMGASIMNKDMAAVPVIQPKRAFCILSIIANFIW